MEDKLLDILEKIARAGYRYVKDQVEWQKRTDEKLVRLRRNHLKIQSVVHFAFSQEQIKDQNPVLNQRLWKLRDAIDDADDALDELEYMELEKQHTKNKKLTRVSSKMKFMKKRIVKIGKRALEIDPTLNRLEEAVQNLDEVFADDATFLRLVELAKNQHQVQQLQLQEAREKGALPENDLIVRGKQKEIVMNWLRNPSNHEHQTTKYGNISLLCIVGHGGMGKTTLLQHVYKDEITEEFDHKMWVFVSKSFDVKKVFADILECLKTENPPLKTLAQLQRRVEEEVKSKKFLLMLDDIWEEDEMDKSKWEVLLCALASGGFGSKILLTARTYSVALMLDKVIRKKTKIVKLDGLEEDECLLLLNTHAFADVAPDHYKKLRSIAGEIVKKLLGSPLAATVIGGVLREKMDEKHWRTVLESDLLGKNSINSLLRLSYMVLPSHLQNCFAFCCIFPQNHTFDKDDLVRMWIALGFIKSSQGMTMEDIGGSYFDGLVKKNLFEKVGDDYKMHNLIHESASKYFEQECGKLVDDEEPFLKITETIRHLSIQTCPDILRKIEKFKHLHSLFLIYKASNEDICSVLIDIFNASKNLRLLYVYAPDLEIIPEEIRNLKHLRYLKIVGYSLTMLPRSLSNLYHLQYIIYDSPSYDTLGEIGQHNCISSICGIGKFKCLQELDIFYLKDVSGYRIGELENMNDLYKLGINCLENVKGVEEACSAKLCEKRRLTDLTLCWSWNHTDSRNTDLDEKVLDNLQPPICLRNLSIKRYMGARSAKWMNNVNPIFNLEKIELTDCLKCETLPPFGQLRWLKSLTLFNMPKVKWFESKFNGNDVSHAFPSLEVLHISNLKALEDWFEAGVAPDDGYLFPRLIELVLFKCPKLKELPSLPSKLKCLNIRFMGWKTLYCCSISNSISLETLEVSDCSNITYLPLADEIARFAALRCLTIRNCPYLISLERYREVETTNNCHLMLSDLSINDPFVLLMEPLRSIVSLKKLTITKNNVLVSFSNEVEQWFLNVSSSLSELEFGRLESLQSLPSSLESLSSLQKLHIYDAPMLLELPNLPSSLKSLSIWRCHPELKERYPDDGGFDRHKIAHIPHIQLLDM